MTLGHYIDDIMLPRPSEQKTAGILDALVRHIHARRWDISPTEIQGPATLVKFLNLLDVCVENNLTCPKGSVALAMGCRKVISCPWNVMSIGVFCFVWPWASHIITMRIWDGGFGSCNIYRCDLLRARRLRSATRAVNHAYLMVPCPAPKYLYTHGGLGKLPWLAILHEYRYKSMPGSNAVQTPRGEDNWELCVWHLPGFCPWYFFLRLILICIL